MILTERGLANAQYALGQWHRVGIAALRIELFDLCIQRGGVGEALR
jgi:hypothetical protein